MTDIIIIVMALVPAQEVMVEFDRGQQVGAIVQGMIQVRDDGRTRGRLSMFHEHPDEPGRLVTLTVTFEEAEATEDNGEWLITFTGWGEVSDGRGRRPAAGDVFTGQIGPWRIGDDPIWQFHSGDVYTNATFQPATRLQAPAEPVRR